MGGRRRQRPGAGRTGAGRPARPTADPGKAKAARPARPTADPGKSKADRFMRALNPRKQPTRSRVRLAALAFAGLTIVLGILGFTVDGGYLRSAVLTAILALLWGVVSLNMR